MVGFKDWFSFHLRLKKAQLPTSCAFHWHYGIGGGGGGGGVIVLSPMLISVGVGLSPLTTTPGNVLEV